jgi:ADP-ribosylglycohydrolase
MTRPAWSIARELLEAAVPVDRRVEPQRWTRGDFTGIDERRMRIDAWGAAVPGSGAWDAMWPAAVASCAERGLAVGVAESMLEAGLRLRLDGDEEALLAHDDLFRAALRPAMRSRAVPIPEAPVGEVPDLDPALDIDEAVLRGWTGQIAGAAFGTPLEGCTGPSIAAVYGSRIEGYPAHPDTLNDDVVYELVLLDAIEEIGRGWTSADIGRAWAAEVPFGWSAEWVALGNLRAGIAAPASGIVDNPFSDWIGAQMRGMAGGLLAPGRPLAARRWAAIDAAVSHDADGAAGGMWAAMLCALSFSGRSVREILVRSCSLLPEGRTRSVITHAIDVCRASSASSDAWAVLDAALVRFGWVHAFPNAAAVTVALWFDGDDLTTAFATLARCGLDVDCNAGLVGTVCGIRKPVPEEWAGPLGGRFDTYLPRHPTVEIGALARRTTELSAVLVGG